MVDNVKVKQALKQKIEQIYRDVNKK